MGDPKMIIEDLQGEFYEFLAGKQVFMIINNDIDGICSCRILQTLLRHKHTLYSLGIVCGIEDLKRTYRENRDDVKHFVLVNCGGTVDIVDLLEPDEDAVFFVLDSHRPADLCNVYSDGQVRMVFGTDEEQNVPEFERIFRDDESDEEAASDGEENDPKRRRLDEAAILKRRERRLWEENRNKLLFEYSQFTYYSKASAILLFNLAWKVNKDTKELLWLAIVSLTEQMLFGKIDTTQYVLETGNLQMHVTRIQNRTNDADVQASLKILFEKDLKLSLYRHWSVESALKYSMFTACKMKLWSLKGDKKLHELLADMGLPLVQSKQNFSSMDLALRQEFQGALERLSEKYGLADVVYVSFTLQYGYRNKYSATDIVFALTAILEANSYEKNSEECFHAALECLSRSNPETLKAAIEKAKFITQTLFKTVQSALDMKLIISAGPFVYYIIQEGCLDWCMFSKPHILSLLAQFILRAYVAMSRNKKASSLPLIVSAPYNLETGVCIVMGIPPLCENSPKNLFGKAFEQAAERINCDSVCDYFDTAYFQLHTKNRTRFFDSLTTLLS